ncbi:hypothetical protein J3F83DRAFT_210875 [Trichoderma novae-zelandiae]
MTWTKYLGTAILGGGGLPLLLTISIPLTRTCAQSGGVCESSKSEPKMGSKEDAYYMAVHRGSTTLVLPTPAESMYSTQKQVYDTRETLTRHSNKPALHQNPRSKGGAHRNRASLLHTHIQSCVTTSTTTTALKQRHTAIELHRYLSPICPDRGNKVDLALPRGKKKQGKKEKDDAMRNVPCVVARDPRCVQLRDASMCTLVSFVSGCGSLSANRPCTPCIYLYQHIPHVQDVGTSHTGVM